MAASEDSGARGGSRLLPRRAPLSRQHRCGARSAAPVRTQTPCGRRCRQPLPAAAPIDTIPPATNALTGVVAAAAAAATATAAEAPIGTEVRPDGRSRRDCGVSVALLP